MMTLPKTKSRTVSLTFDRDVSIYTGMYALARHVYMRNERDIIGTENVTVDLPTGNRTFSVEVEN